MSVTRRSLERDTGVAVGKMDDAAVCEPRLFQTMTHYGIVLVGIDSDIVKTLRTPVEAGLRYAVMPPPADKTVDCQHKLSAPVIVRTYLYLYQFVPAARQDARRIVGIAVCIIYNIGFAVAMQDAGAD